MAETTQIVGFVLGDEHYGVDIMHVESIIRPVEITPVPRAPGFVEGIINLRGNIIPIVDLRKRLNMPVPAENDDTRIVIAFVGDRRLGVMVDKVERVMNIPNDNIDVAPGTASKAASQYVSGVARTGERGETMIILLDIFRIFSAEEHEALSKIKP